MIDLWVAVPFLASLVLLGMPHGAIDHILYFRHRGQPMTPSLLAVFVLFYLGLAVAMAALWLAFPLGCCLFFLLLTWAHWGEGDFLAERAQGGKVGFFFGFSRGSYPVLLPFVSDASSYLDVLNGALSLSGREMPPEVTTLVLSKGFPLGILAFVVVLTLGERMKHRNSPRWKEQTLEILVLWVLFLLLPPLFSVGLYFIFWHSLRHIRLMGRKIGEPLARFGRVDWRVFYRWAAPFTLAGILFVLGWFLWNSSGQREISSIIGSYLVVLWALTWPHALLTHWIFRWGHLRG